MGLCVMESNLYVFQCVSAVPALVSAVCLCLALRSSGAGLSWSSPKALVPVDDLLHCCLIVHGGEIPQLAPLPLHDLPQHAPHDLPRAGLGQAFNHLKTRAVINASQGSVKAAGACV